MEYPVWLPHGNGCIVQECALQIVCVEPAEAPVVLEWYGDDMDRKGMLFGGGGHAYRLHDGKLWMPSLGCRAMTRGELHRALGHDDISSDLLYMLESGLVQFPWISRPGKPVERRRAGTRDADIDAVIDACAPEVAERLLLVGDEIWMRTNGPVLRMNRLGADTTRIFYGGRNGRDVETGAIYDCTEIGAIDRDAVSPHFKVAYGWDRAGVRQGFREFGFDRASLGALVEPVILDKAAERAVWSYLWIGKRFGSDATSAMVETILEAREALVRRWPGVEMDFAPRNYVDRARHLYARELPPANDLLPVLRRILSVSEGRLPAWMTKAWRLVLSQLATRVAAETEDMADLRSISI